MSRIPLTVETAEVTTAAVEVKTLTIKGKQVTLAVFRQLEEKVLLNDDASLNGLPWGRVNYHPDKYCQECVSHIHVVWQEGNELRRSEVRDSKYSREGYYNDNILYDYWMAFYIEGDDRFRVDEVSTANYVNFLVDNVQFRTSIQEYYVVQDRDRYGRYTGTWSWGTFYSANQKLPVDISEVDSDQVLTEMNQLIKLELDRRESMKKSYQSLLGLPQLFIAV